MMNNGINKTDRLCLSYVTEDTGGDDNVSDDDDIEDDMLEFNSNTDHNDNQIDDEDDEDDNDDEDEDDKEQVMTGGTGLSCAHPDSII